MTETGLSWEDRQREAEVAKLEAEAEVLRTKAQYQAYELRNFETAASEARIFVFSAVVNAETVDNAIRTLDNWSRRFPEEDMMFIINSPGGSIIEGFALFDFLKHLESRGHHTTTKAMGEAASMGAILLQAGTKRVMTPNAYLLLHDTSGGTQGNMGEMEDTMAFYKMLQGRIQSIVAERSGLSLKAVKAKMNRKDSWMDADTALKLGLIDEISY